MLPDSWTERRRAIATAARWLRQQDWDRAYRGMPAYAVSFLETFERDLLEELRWAESVPFPYLSGLLEGHFAPRVEAFRSAHHELRARLVELRRSAQAALETGRLAEDFGPTLRDFLADLERHNEEEGRLWEVVRPAADLRGWPDGPGRWSSRTGAFA